MKFKHGVKAYATYARQKKMYRVIECLIPIRASGLMT